MLLAIIECRIKHAHAPRGAKSPTWIAWRDAKRRYGERMCREWFDSVETFLQDVGHKPSTACPTRQAAVAFDGVVDAEAGDNHPKERDAGQAPSRSCRGLQGAAAVQRVAKPALLLTERHRGVANSALSLP
jgi:hypothetical protein